MQKNETRLPSYTTQKNKQSTKMENILTNDTSDKELISKTDKEFIKLNTKKPPK